MLASSVCNICMRLQLHQWIEYTSAANIAALTSPPYPSHSHRFCPSATLLHHHAPPLPPNTLQPMLLTFIMFVAMAFALPIFMVQQALKAPADRAVVPGRVLWWLAIPSIFDLAGTNLAQIGLVYTTVSYFQLLRCTVIVVTAILKAFVLKHSLAAYMWVGVGINIVAMILVSLTNFIAPPDPAADGASDPALGAFFIILSCVVQGRYVSVLFYTDISFGQLGPETLS